MALSSPKDDPSAASRAKAVPMSDCYAIVLAPSSSSAGAKRDDMG